MNTFNLVIVFISIGVVVIASLAGICAVILELGWSRRLISTLKKHNVSGQAFPQLYCLFVRRLRDDRPS